MPFEPLRGRLRAGHARIRERGADYLAYAVLDSIIDHVFPVVEAYADELDALEMVDDADDEDALPGDLLRAMKKHKITASAAAQRLLPDINERIREHLMQYPELMTPEILQDFFPELLEALERPKH